MPAGAGRIARSPTVTTRAQRLAEHFAHRLGERRVAEIQLVGLLRPRCAGRRRIPRCARSPRRRPGARTRSGKGARAAARAHPGPALPGLWGRRFRLPAGRRVARKPALLRAVQLERRGPARAAGRLRPARDSAAAPAADAAPPAAAEIRQRLLDGQQPAGLHQPHQPDLQVKPRLQAKTAGRETDRARAADSASGPLRKTSPAISASLCALRGRGGDQAASPRRRCAPPAGCGSSAPARG